MNAGVAEQLKDLNNLLLATAYGPPAAFYAVHIVVALYRAFWGEGWSRRLGVTSLTFGLFSIIYLLLPQMAQYSLILLLIAIIAQLVSGLLPGYRKRWPDVVYVLMLLVFAGLFFGLHYRIDGAG